MSVLQLQLQADCHEADSLQREPACCKGLSCHDQAACCDACRGLCQCDFCPHVVALVELELSTRR